MGIISAHGVGKEANWAKARKGLSSIGNLTTFNSLRYRGKQGGEAKDFASATLHILRNKRLDRASHLLIHTIREALSDAGILATMMDVPVLLSLGTTLGGMLSGQAFHREVLAKGFSRTRLSLVFDYLAHSQVINAFKEFQLKGDFLIFSDACASGTTAIGHAFHAIRRGDYEIAVCGGYDTMCEFTFSGFNSLMSVTPHLCRPFDKNRDGLVLGEGAGILILEDLGRAVGRNAPIIAEIVGYGASADAYHLTSPEPTGKSAARAMEEAWTNAGSPPVDYINAHGTGTPYNDVMEARAIALVFGNRGRDIPVSSIKPMIGHVLGGAGAVEAVLSLLSLQHKTLLPNINFETPDPECALNIIKETRMYNIMTVLSNSFGFGGANASIVMKEF